MISYDSWEYLYFQQILDLHEIFCAYMKNLTSRNFYTLEFLKEFGKFIRTMSKDNPTEYQYIEPLNESALEIYTNLCNNR